MSAPLSIGAFVVDTAIPNAFVKCIQTAAFRTSNRYCGVAKNARSAVCCAFHSALEVGGAAGLPSIELMDGVPLRPIFDLILLRIRAVNGVGGGVGGMADDTKGASDCDSPSSFDWSSISVLKIKSDIV